MFRSLIQILFNVNFLYKEINHLLNHLLIVRHKTAVELIFLNNTIENIEERLKYKRKRRKLYSKICHHINFAI